MFFERVLCNNNNNDDDIIDDVLWLQVAAVLLLSVAAQAQLPVWNYAAHSAYWAQPWTSLAVQRSAVFQPWSLATSNQFHQQTELGQAAFGYAHPGQAAVNYRDALGNQVGSWAYFDVNVRTRCKYLSSIFQLSFKKYLSSIFQVSFKKYLSRSIFQEVSFKYLPSIFQVSFKYLSSIFQVPFKYLSSIFQVSFKYVSGIKRNGSQMMHSCKGNAKKRVVEVVVPGLAMSRVVSKPWSAGTTR